MSGRAMLGRPNDGVVAIIGEKMVPLKKIRPGVFAAAKTVPWDKSSRREKIAGMYSSVKY